MTCVLFVPQFDIKNKRVFLRRCPFPSLKLSDLFLGAKLTVCVAFAGVTVRPKHPSGR